MPHRFPATVHFSAQLRAPAKKLPLMAVLVLGLAVAASGALPAPARAQTGPGSIQIAAQGSPDLYQGCNSVIVQAPVGTVWPDIVAHFSDPTAVRVLWQYNNGLRRYQAVYFADADAPIDGYPVSVLPVQALFACVSAAGSVS